MNVRDRSGGLASTLSPAGKLTKGDSKSDSFKAGVGPGLARGVTMKKQPKQRKNVPAKIFEGVIMTLIIISSITLVIDNPQRDPEAADIVFVGYLDNCFTVLFTLEATIKIVAMGFLFNNAVLRERGMTPYIRNPWNMLDFIVVVASLIDFLVTIQSKGVDVSEVDAAEQAKIASSL